MSDIYPLGDVAEVFAQLAADIEAAQRVAAKLPATTVVAEFLPVLLIEAAALARRGQSASLCGLHKFATLATELADERAPIEDNPVDTAEMLKVCARLAAEDRKGVPG